MGIEFSTLDLKPLERLAMYAALDKYGVFCKPEEQGLISKLSHIVRMGEGKLTEEEYKTLMRIYREYLSE